NGIKHRLHVGGRAANDAEHLGGCRLMLQSFPQFRGALLDLLEQAGVLDRDHGFVGQSFWKGKLFFGKRANLHPTNHNCSDRDTLTQQWRNKYGPDAQSSGERRWEVLLWFCCKVMNVNGLPVNDSSAGYSATIVGERTSTQLRSQRSIISH